METDQIRRVLAGEKVVSLQHGGGEQAMQQYNELLAYVGRLERVVIDKGSPLLAGATLRDGHLICLDRPRWLHDSESLDPIPEKEK